MPSFSISHKIQNNDNNKQEDPYQQHYQGKEEDASDRIGRPSEGKRYMSSISEWTERWFLSSNAKDIGTLYLIFALLAGLVGTAFSVLIRLELSGPGVQFIADNQLYNSIITAHAIVMIFFMVKKYFIYNSHFTFFRQVNNDNNGSPLLSECDNNNGDHNPYN